jgi:hypothetical protein
MSRKRFWIITGILVLLALAIHFYSADGTRVENTYAVGIYPPIAAFLRHLFGWLPISFGDILYGSFVVWILWKLIKAIRALFKKRVNRQSFVKGLSKLTIILLSLYIFFNFIWGINYSRSGIADQLQLKMEKYSINELENLNGILVEKVNAAKRSLINSKEAYPTSKELFAKVQEAYAAVETVYPFLQYHTISIKPSLWGWLGNYTGFTGYYNPFTGEAQVNTTVPKFLQPFITCHEVAHQLGYAKEMEANFVGYLAASASKDTLFHYSVYLDLFLYSNRNLYRSDSAAAGSYAMQLSPEIKTDIKEWREFNRRHSNPIEPVIRWLYGKYLESNEQPQGVLSYDEVTSFMIAYYKKFGKI